MKPLRLALFIILLIFHATLVIVSLNFSQSLADSIVRNPSAFRFLTFFGLAVFLITFAFAWFDRRTALKKVERLEAEKNAIKAEVFDREKRTQEREREIEQEIESFRNSLPSSGTSTAPTPDRDAPPLIESSPTESHQTEPSPAESHQDERPPAGPPLSHSRPAEEEEVEYGPLIPKDPSYDLSEPDQPPSDPEADRKDKDTDTNPPRS